MVFADPGSLHFADPDPPGSVSTELPPIGRWDIGGTPARPPTCRFLGVPQRRTLRVWSPLRDRGAQQSHHAASCGAELRAQGAW